MLVFRRFLLLVFIALPVLLTGQDMTVEQSYLHQSIENMIIREMSRGDSREMKLVALEYIGNAIERGNMSDEVRVSLEHLSMEGTGNIIRESGRVTNNYPGIRTAAATHLGQFQTVEAKDALVKMVLLDNEPMVITEAIKSLSTIGIDEGGEVVSAINWMVDRFDRNVPNDLLAISAMEAFETFAEINGYVNPASIRTVMRIIEGPYSTPVRARARQSLEILRGYRYEQ